MGQSTANGGGWIVGVEVEDIAALRKLLNDNGHQTGDYHDTPAGVVMDFADPDGNRLQAMQIGVKAASVLGQ
jgi:predicted enzyme related to lactoylglutathione lyase